jgi:alpha-mannosidase
VARIAEGRWEPAGAMWVEPDANLTSGESLIRQLLYGQRFLKERFGRRCGVLWLPDAFGYSGALPQLMRSAGVHTFVTIKLSWNTTNRMPHDTFRWRGIDGTEVLGYFMTAGDDWQPIDWMRDPYPIARNASTYNGRFTVKEAVGNWVRYRDKSINTSTLYAFGWGDGGGGPTERMLEYADRLRDYPGLPAISQGQIEPFLKELGDRVLPDPRTAVWEGELYLEYHRGTYTSQARAKLDNRRADQLLRDAELWCAWASTLGKGNAKWPERLARCWEDVLLNQFHDILPGSSIGEVYQDQRRQHAAVLATTGGVLAEAQDALVGEKGDDVRTIAVFSAAPFARNGTLEMRLPDGVSLEQLPNALDGTPILAQAIAGTPDRGVVLVSGLAVPPLGYAIVPLAAAKARAAGAEITVSEKVLENRFFRIELDDHGNFASLYDKRFDREVLAPGGGGNRLLAFEDRPINYDAWDIDEFYVDKCSEILDVQSWRVVETGPVRAGIEIKRAFGTSTISQRILLHADTPRVDIYTEIDWRQRQVLLKATFPLAVHSPRATYECAFGYVERPTHRNTSWDAARFEVAGHRWADVSETDYGVSLLNDGKYGHDCLGNVLRLTLLKSAIMPDPLADEGAHSFSYALLPHGPGWTIADTVRAASEFNLPVHVRAARPGESSTPAQRSLVRSSAAHAIVDSVKPAEDGEGLIVRVYDCANARGPVTLEFAHAVARAEAVTILEEPDPNAGPFSITDKALHFAIHPFQVRSFRVHLQP